MENYDNWVQRKMVANEIIEGMKMAKQLSVYLNTQSSTETPEALLQRILSSYEKALMVLKHSVNEDFNQQNASKKRKVMNRRSDQLKVSCENGLQWRSNDGFSWRKYGQKDILGAKFPRSYYRCTFRNTRNCNAMKQVQRSDQDHSIFDITYRGTHTCSGNQCSVPAPPSPEKELLHPQDTTLFSFIEKAVSFPSATPEYNNNMDFDFLQSVNSSVTNYQNMEFDFSLEELEIDSFDDPMLYS